MKKFLIVSLILSLLMVCVVPCLGQGGRDYQARVLTVSRWIDLSGRLFNRVVIGFTDGDTTPSVYSSNIFKEENTGATTITTFDNAVTGQEIGILFTTANTIIDFTGTNLLGNGGVDWTSSANSLLSGYYDGTNWYCVVTDGSGGAGAGGADPQPVYPHQFIPVGDGGDNDVSSLSTVDATNRHEMRQITANANTQDTDLYAYPLLAQALSGKDITISVNVSDKDNCTVNLLITDSDGNDDATGTVDITPVANDTWEDQTYTLTSSYAEDEKIRIKVSIVSLDTADIVRVGICTIPFN